MKRANTVFGAEIWIKIFWSPLSKIFVGVPPQKKFVYLIHTFIIHTTYAVGIQCSIYRINGFSKILSIYFVYLLKYCVRTSSGAFHDMDRAMFWICKEASVDFDSNFRSLHSVKIWLKVIAQYESANPEAPNYKSFESELGRYPTTVGEYPLNEINLIDHYKPYREALRILSDRMLSGHANIIRKESGFVLSRIINCQLIILKFNQIGSAYQPFP